MPHCWQVYRGDIVRCPVCAAPLHVDEAERHTWACMTIELPHYFTTTG